MPSYVSVSTESMKDRLFKASHRCKNRIDVKRILVSCQSIKSCLIARSLLSYSHIRRSIRRLNDSFSLLIIRHLLSTKVSRADHKDRCLIVCNLFICFSIKGLRGKNNHCSRSLVQDIDYSSLTLESSNTGKRFVKLQVLFSMYEFSWIEFNAVRFQSIVQEIGIGKGRYGRYYSI